jgi:hypothetical protein
VPLHSEHHVQRDGAIRLRRCVVLCAVVPLLNYDAIICHFNFLAASGMQRGITKFDVVMGKDGGSHVHLEQNIAPSAAELLIDPTPAWAATACCDVVTQAQQLLADAWHEGDYEARLRVLLQNSGQQLQAPDDWGRQLAAMKLSSKAIGQAFDAVWYDASQLRCVLVPNSFMRHKFPQG